jgi:hypothetical protein
MSACVQEVSKAPASKEWSASTRWQLLGLAVGQVVLLPLAEWLSLRDSVLHFVGLVLGFGFSLFPLAMILAIPAAMLGLCLHHQRRNSLWLLLCSLAAVACFAFGLTLSFPIKRAGLDGVMRRAEPLIEAIRKHEATSGRPPDELAELVPNYLPAIPTPGIGTSPEFYYRRPSPESDLEGNPWMLEVRPPVFGIGFDTFIYLPKQNYPHRGWGGVLERIGTWAYVHE